VPAVTATLEQLARAASGQVRDAHSESGRTK
jgi:hypothetical protein